MARRFLTTLVLASAFMTTLPISVCPQRKSGKAAALSAGTPLIDTNAASIVGRAIQAHNKITSYNVDIELTTSPTQKLVRRRQRERERERQSLSVEYFASGK